VGVDRQPATTRDGRAALSGCAILAPMAYTVTDLLRLPLGEVSLADHDPGDTSGFDGSKKEAEKALQELGDELTELQEKLYASAYVGGSRRVLLVLQGMDTSGKGGVIDHAVGLMSPNGVALHSFKKPTDEEREHDFLWRVEKALPAAGVVGVFDRSHYEDVLVARVHELADEAEIERRYDAINAFEKSLVDSGTVVIKCVLHISSDKQRERLLARLDDPEKQWKFKPGDVDERARWDDYRSAYETALTRCNTDDAPWYVVPSDSKWYRNWAVGQLLVEALRGMKLEWPEPSYDVDEQRARLSDEQDAS
jgi:PPK2 family polyphosphate:nucleotide phosphotransferase